MHLRPVLSLSAAYISAALLLTLSACGPPTSEEAALARIEKTAQLDKRARDDAADMVFFGHKEANLCFVRVPRNNATWGSLVPCTPEVCRLLIGERPAACDSSAPNTVKAPTPSHEPIP